METTMIYFIIGLSIFTVIRIIIIKVEDEKDLNQKRKGLIEDFKKQKELQEQELKLNIEKEKLQEKILDLKIRKSVEEVIKENNIEFRGDKY